MSYNLQRMKAKEVRDLLLSSQGVEGYWLLIN